MAPLNHSVLSIDIPSNFVFHGLNLLHRDLRSCIIRRRTLRILIFNDFANLLVKQGVEPVSLIVLLVGLDKVSGATDGEALRVDHRTVVRVWVDRANEVLSVLDLAHVSITSLKSTFIGLLPCTPFIVRGRIDRIMIDSAPKTLPLRRGRRLVTVDDLGQMCLEHGVNHLLGAKTWVLGQLLLGTFLP